MVGSSLGLGILIEVKDGASSAITGIQQKYEQLRSTAENGTQSLTNDVVGLTASGYALQQTGNQLMGMGTAITSSLAGATKEVINVGMVTQNARRGLTQLFGSAQEGEKAFQWVKDYSKTSMFEFEDLLPTMQMMKVVGIDIRKEIATTTGESQNLLQYAGDIAAFQPQMRNSFGTGIQASVGALKEYIAEGNAMTLKRSAGLDIKGILGEEKGATAEDRARQVADMVKKSNLMGMTAKLEGTANVQLSNMQDLVFNFKSMVADSGITELYTGLVTKVSEYLNTISDAEWKSLAEVVSEGLQLIIKPIGKVLDFVLGLVSAFRKFAKEHPGIIKVVIALTALVGVVLTVGGALLVLSGGVLLATAGFMMFKTSMGLLGSAFELVKSKFLVSFLPIIAFAGLLYLAYKTNFMGIGDLVKSLGETLKIVGEMLGYIFGNSEQQMQGLVRAREEGIEPLYNGVNDLKGAFQMLFMYIGDGISSVITGLWDFLANMGLVSERTRTVGDETKTVSDNVNGFKDSLNGLGQTFTDITNAIGLEGLKGAGDIIGKIIGVFVILAPVVWVVTKIIAVVSSLWTILVTVGSAIASIVGFVGGAISAIMGVVVPIITFIGGLISTIASFVASVIATLNPVTLVILAIVAVVVGLYFAFKNNLFGITDAVSGFVGGIVSWFTQLFTAIGIKFSQFVAVIQALPQILMAGLSIIGQIINDIFIQPFKNAVTTVISIFANLGKNIWNGMKGGLNWVIDGLNGFITTANKLKVDVPGVGKVGVDIPLIPKLNTGGETTGTGMAVLHPNEVVVNSPLTNMLRKFLTDYTAIRGSIAPSSTEGSTKQEATTATPTNVSSQSVSNKTVRTDNRTIFEKGSIYIHVDKINDAEIDSLADKIEERITRKQELKELAVRDI